MPTFSETVRFFKSIVGNKTKGALLVRKGIRGCYVSLWPFESFYVQSLILVIISRVSLGKTNNN